MSRGEHFLAEAKNLLSQPFLTSSTPMASLTCVQAIPLIALMEASRMRNAAAWHYSSWFFNVCLELGLPDATDRNGLRPEIMRLCKMAVSYALFLTER